MLKIGELYLETICTAPRHSLTIYQVLAQLGENSRRSYLETNHIFESLKGNNSVNNWWTLI